MKCAVHPEVDATSYCRNCGKALCAECARDVRGISYCEACLADLVTKPQPVAGGPSPALAAILGFVPGLGAVYNGEYTKALVHVLIFAGFIGALNSNLGDAGSAFMGLLLAAFIFYMPIDAHRVAKARLRGEAPAQGLAGAAVPAEGAPSADRPLGPLILIGVGVLFLLHTMHLISVGRIFEFWPLILIAVGVMLLWKRLQGTR